MEESVLAIIAEETDSSADDLTLESRLTQDIGVEAGDAWQLLLKFERTYETDLTSLYDHWDRHFGPEEDGHSWQAYLFRVAAAGLIGDLLNALYRPIPSWAWAIAVVTGFHCLPDRFFSKRPRNIPIPLGELVKAAIEKRWNHPYARVG